MRIELNSGGLKGASTISDLQKDMKGLVKKSNAVISVFQAVKSQTRAVNGGIGSLQQAVSQIESRIKTEQTKLEHLQDVQTKTDQFIENTKKTDLKVAGMVMIEKNKFQSLNPWAKPEPKPVPKEQNAWDKAWNWLTDKANQVTEKVKSGFDFVKDKVVTWGKNAVDTIQKGWEKAKSWCKEKWENVKNWCVKHKDAIKVAISVVVVAALAVAAIATGGATLAVGALIGATMGGAFGVAGNAVSNFISGKRGWDVMEGWQNSLFTGVIGGAITGGVGGAAGQALKQGAITAGKYMMINAGSSMASSFLTGTTNEFLEDGEISASDWKKIGFDVGKSGATSLASNVFKLKISPAIANKINGTTKIPSNIKNVLTKFVFKTPEVNIPAQNAPQSFKEVWNHMKTTPISQKDLFKNLKDTAIKNVTKIVKKNAIPVLKTIKMPTITKPSLPTISPMVLA